MNCVKKILAISVIVSLLVPSVAFAKEGMYGRVSSDTEQVYSYEEVDGYIIKNQWKKVWDNWYYFGEDGKSIQNKWSEIDGNWYYFDNWSRMLHDTTTPDGYYVGSDGAWVTE